MVAFCFPRMVTKLPVALDKYEWVELLAAGASSQLHLARALDPRDTQPVVLKLPARLDDERALSQLRNEAACLADLAHAKNDSGSSIVELIAELHTDGQLQGLALEYVRGPTLDTLIASHGALPWRWVVALLHAMLEALDVVHRAGWVHLDLKPANLICVVFRSFDELPRVKLIDFGVAKRIAVDTREVGTGDLLGTATYMSPEHAAGRPVDERADLYSLGVVLFEMLAGQPPFRAASAAELMWEHINRPAPRIVELNTRAHVPTALAELISRMLAKDPKHRPESAAQLLAELEHASLTAAFVSLSATPVDPESTATHASAPPSGVEPKTDQEGELELAALADRVRDDWIAGVLEVSTSGMTMVPQQRRVTLAGEIEVLDSRTSLGRVFERAGGRLQIVAPAGYGKTVQLLRLARLLLDEHRRDPRRPVPVVFNMSAWQADDRGLTEFLTRELVSKYSVRRALARAWLKQGRLLPMLDGVDEVFPAWRERAIDAIVRELADRRGMVLSFRPELHTLREALRDVATIELCELAHGDTARYLAGDWLRLRAAFERFPELEELAQTPLMLHLMRVSVSDSDFLATPQTAGSPIRWLYGRYVHALMSSTRANAIHRQGVTTQLGALGRTLCRAKRAMLLLEELQPAMLSSAGLRWVYLLGSRLLTATALCGLAVVTIVTSPLDNRGFDASPRFALCLTIEASLALGLGFALWARLGPRIRSSISATLAFGAVLGLLLNSGLGLAGFEHEMVLVFSLEAGLIGAAVLGIARRTRNFPDHDIEALESLRWDLRRIPRRNWLLLAIVAIALLVVFGVVLSPLAGVQLSLLVSLLSVGIMASRHARIEHKSTPNLGMHRSLRNAGRVGALGFTIVLAGFGLPYDLGYGALTGSFAALVAALWFGGTDVLQHYLLRILLWIDGSLALQPTPSCNAGVYLGLLRRVGNGYMFAHASLRDYFAELTKSELEVER